jgi:aspartate/glutamate racemase
VSRKTLALVHTTAVTVSVLGSLCRSELPGVRVVNLLDDSLLEDVMVAGEVTAPVEARLAAYVAQAKVLGADAVLCCCSSVGEAAERIGASAPLPVWRIDAAMAEEAARIGGSAIVLATVATTLGPTARLVERAFATRRGSVESVLVADAFDRLRAGDAAAHDALVAKAVEHAAAKAHVIVLAQASMGRVLASLDPAPTIPILSSPPLAFARLREQLLGGVVSA